LHISINKLQILLFWILCQLLISGISKVRGAAHSSENHRKKEVSLALERSTWSILSLENENSIIVFKIFWWLGIGSKCSFIAV